MDALVEAPEVEQPAPIWQPGPSVAPDWPRELPARCSLIGEAPAETEVILGRPFVGRAGKELNGALRQVGISRWDCHVTNVFSQRLPGDNIEGICLNRRDAYALLVEWEAANGPHPFRAQCLNSVTVGHYVPAPIVAAELSRLRAELERASPNIVVVLGGTACWGVLGTLGHGVVSRVRGALTHEALTGRKAVASYHPAAVGRNPKLREFLLSDLVRTKEEYDHSPLQLDDRTILIPERPAEVRAFLLSCIGVPTAVDIETKKGQIDCIGFAPDRRRAMCVPIWSPEAGHYWSTPEAEAAVVDLIAWYMEQPSPKIFQYGAQYDCWWLWEHWRIRTIGPYEDTRLLMHAMSPEQDKDLASIGGMFERLGPWKMMRRAKGGAKRDD